ncbi:hypothetical protein PO909_013470 [Leuciscus waleckii]
MLGQRRQNRYNARFYDISSKADRGDILIVHDQKSSYRTPLVKTRPSKTQTKTLQDQIQNRDLSSRPRLDPSRPDPEQRSILETNTRPFKTRSRTRPILETQTKTRPFKTRSRTRPILETQTKTRPLKTRSRTRPILETQTKTRPYKTGSRTETYPRDPDQD